MELLLETVMLKTCLFMCIAGVINCGTNVDFNERARCHNLTKINQDDLTREELLHKLLICSDTYDNKIPPTYDENFPTDVIVQIYILSIHSVNEASMDFSVDLFLRQSWVDPRLKYTHSEIEKLELGTKMMDFVWIPDTFFVNEKDASFHVVTVPNKLMFLHHDGSIFYSLRISLTFSCYMKLLNFPLDTQNCPIRMESYGYTKENVLLNWNSSSPLVVPDYIGLPQFSLTHYEKDDDCHFMHGDVNFTCLEATLHLERNRGFYILQIFVPSILIVMLSWVSFWIDIDAVPARVSLGLMTVLTMTTHTSGTHAMLPRVSYVKAIDIWMATCISFVFGSLLEFAYINVMSRKLRRQQCSNNPTSVILNQVPSSLIMYKDFRERARKADKFSRVAFPVSFILFNIFFWTFFIYYPS